MKQLIQELIETIEKQYNEWKSFKTEVCDSKDNFYQAEKIDQIQKYYYWFTEDSFDRLSDVFRRIKNPKTKIEKMLKSNNILKDLYDDCFCVCNEPPNTLYWAGIEELFLIYCNQVLDDEEE